METIKKNTIFTNVAETEDGDVYWEGLEKERDMSTPITSWLKVRNWTKDSGKPAAHPNSRYVVFMSVSFRYLKYSSGIGHMNMLFSKIVAKIIVYTERLASYYSLISILIFHQYTLFLQYELSVSKYFKQ